MPAGGHKDESPRGQRVQACKLEAARAVGWREQCLMSLNTLVLNWPAETKKKRDRRDDHRIAEAVRWLKNQSLELRDAGLNCVEKVPSQSHANAGEVTPRSNGTETRHKINRNSKLPGHGQHSRPNPAVDMVTTVGETSYQPRRIAPSLRGSRCAC